MNSTIKHYIQLNLIQHLNWRTLGSFIFVFFVYFFTAKLFLYLNLGWSTSATLIWPPVGIALVAFILWGYQMWLPVFAAQFLAIYTDPSAPYSIALIFAAAHVFQAIVGLYLLRLLKFDQTLRDSRSMFTLVGVTLLVTLVEPLIATIAEGTLGTLPISPLVNLGRGWGAGIFSVLVIVPFVLTWYKQPWLPHARYKKFEIAVALLTLLGVVYFLFWTNTPSYFGISIIFYLPAVLSWFVMRFSVRWLTLAILATSVLGIIGTVLVGPTSTLFNGLLLTVEIYIGLVAAIFLVFVSIVEERRSALLKLEEAYRSILATDQAKTDFISILAHELRNPLAPLVSSAELLKRNPQTEESAKAIRSIQEHAGMMSRILDDLLDTARLSHKKFALKTEAVELREILDQSAQSVMEAMRLRNHTFTVHMPDEEMCLFADPVRIKQVVINLLINASKYTKEGGTISLTARKNKDHFQIEVSDNGIGIEPDMLTHIYEPFKQAGAQGHGSGLGLGLFLTKCLVEAHDGTIEVHSEGQGRGSTFIVSLPVPREIVTRKEKKECKAEGKPVEPSCILIVDDNRAAADTLAKLLRYHGHTVHVAYSGADALRDLLRVKPELILLDIGMPEMDGFAVAREIRNRGWKGKIVALSGYGQDIDRVHSKNAGFNDHLLKPVLSDDIIAILERMKIDDHQD